MSVKQSMYIDLLILETQLILNRQGKSGATDSIGLVTEGGIRKTLEGRTK